MWQRRQQGVRGDRRQHRALVRRRHLRHHRPEGAGRSSPSTTSTREFPRSFDVDEYPHGDTDLPPRHGREADRRQAAHARLLLDARLHQARPSPDPGQPHHIGDTDFTTRTPNPPKGHGSPQRATATRPSSRHDNKYVLAADEDFATHRFLGTVDQATGGPFEFSNAGRITVDSTGTHPRPRRSPTHPMVGGDTRPPTSASMDAPAANIPLAPMRTSRSPSSPGARLPVPEQDRECRVQGLHGRAHLRRGATPARPVRLQQPGQPRCSPELHRERVMLWITREAGFRIMGIYNPTTFPLRRHEPNAPPPAPADRGRPGPTSARSSTGPGATCTSTTTKLGHDLEALSTISPSRRRATRHFATGFGDLTVHEFATDPTENLAYSALLRGRHAGHVVRGRRVLDQVGAFDPYAPDTTSGAWSSSRRPRGQRLFAGSDRSFGLYLLRYTGPIAAEAVGGQPADGADPAGRHPGGRQAGPHRPARSRCCPTVARASGRCARRVCASASASTRRRASRWRCAAA